MRFKVLIVTAAFAIVALASACGGGGDKTPDYAADASNTPADSFDFNLLTSVVLLAGDVPSDFEYRARSAPAPPRASGSIRSSKATLYP